MSRGNFLMRFRCFDRSDGPKSETMSARYPVLLPITAERILAETSLRQSTIVHLTRPQVMWLNDQAFSYKSGQRSTRATTALMLLCGMIENPLNRFIPVRMIDLQRAKSGGLDFARGFDLPLQIYLLLQDLYWQIDADLSASFTQSSPSHIRPSINDMASILVYRQARL
jgi:hypothetical protein